MGKKVNIGTADNWNPGEDKTHKITVTDNAGAAVNLAGMALTYSIRATRNGATLSPFTNKTMGAGITTEAGASTSDVAVIDIDAADTTGMDQTVWYVLERTDNDEVQIIVEGTIPFVDIGL